MKSSFKNQERSREKKKGMGDSPSCYSKYVMIEWKWFYERGDYKTWQIKF